VPAALRDLVVELLGAPARVAGVHPHGRQPAEEVVGGGVEVDDADRPRERLEAQGGLGGALGVGPQGADGDGGVQLDRTALEEHAGLAGHVLPGRQHLPDGYVGRPVEDHAQAAVGVRVEHEQHAAREVGVDQRRGGDQQ
jgi:hypothetical protein